MDTSGQLFKNKLDKAFNDPSIKMNSATMGDAMKYKQSFKEEKIEGGIADKKTLKDIAKKHDKKGYYHIDDMVSSLKKQLEKGIKVEMEHTKDKTKAREIAMDHLWEHPNYYDKLEKIEGKEGKEKKYLDIHDMIPELKRQLNKGTMFDKETKKDVSSTKKKETKEATGSGSSGAYVGPVFGGNDEFWKRSKSETPKLKESEVEKVEATEATTSGSVGGYETPAMWAKSTKKKDWGPSRKTQIPGGGFVKIKKKCAKFPYCNQGDINNLKISKNESVKEAIKNVSNRLGVSENTIITILEHEYEKTSKRTK
jgi:copper(I)-binding protein